MNALPTFVLDQLRGDVPHESRLVLDVGCGSGRYLPFLRRQCPMACVVGLDRRPKASDIVPGDVESLQFSDGSFDVVTMIEVIEHVNHPTKALREVWRVLRPSGLLCITTPNYPWKRAFDVRAALRQRSWSRLLDDPTHVSPLSSRRLVALVRDAGFLTRRVVGSAVLGEGPMPILRALRTSCVGHLIANKVYVLAVKP